MVDCLWKVWVVTLEGSREVLIMGFGMGAMIVDVICSRCEVRVGALIIGGIIEQRHRCDLGSPMKYSWVL